MSDFDNMEPLGSPVEAPQLAAIACIPLSDPSLMRLNRPDRLRLLGRDRPPN